MALSKAAGVVHTRALLQAKGQETESRFLSQLTPEEKVAYQTLLPVSKLPIETAVKIYRLAVSLLYPDRSEAEGLRELARVTAWNDLRGVYSVLLRFTSPEFMIKQSAKIWQTYHDAGVAEASSLGPKQAQLRITQYADLPKPFLQIVTGYTQGMMEIAKVKNPRIECRDANPASWEWRVQWD